MLLWSLLLRALLCLCLVLNGMAAASASAHLPMADHIGAASVAANPASMAATQDASCHGHGATAMADQDEATTATPEPAKPKHSPDCCTSGICNCACVHIAQAGVPALQLPASSPDHARSVRALTLGHAAPALPHPIRPPIG